MKGLKGNINKRNEDKQIAFARLIISDKNFVINNNIGNKWLLFAAEIGISDAQKQVCAQCNNVNYKQARELFISNNKNVKMLRDIAFLLYMVNEEELYNSWFDLVIKYHKNAILKCLY